MPSCRPFTRALAAAALLATSLIAVAASAAPQVGDPAPAFTLKTLSGETVRLKDYRGKVVALNFWASWCGPCRKEMPLLDELHQKYSKAGFEMLGVNVDADPAAAEKFLGKVPVSFPTVSDADNRVADQYENQAMPTTFFIDKTGKIANIHRGYRKGDEATYRKVIKQLLVR